MCCGEKASEKQSGLQVACTLKRIVDANKTGLSRVLMLGSSGATNKCIVSQSAQAAIYIF
jgi:hypothetical protein